MPTLASIWVASVLTLLRVTTVADEDGKDKEEEEEEEEEDWAFEGFARMVGGCSNESSSPLLLSPSTSSSASPSRLASDTLMGGPNRTR